MKVIIRENEAGFLKKNGIFVKMLPPGKHRVCKWLGYEVSVEKTAGEVEEKEIPYEVLIKDKAFEQSTIRVEIAEQEMGFVSVNGILTECTKEAEYIAWNCHGKTEVKKVSMEEPEMSFSVTKQMVSILPKKYYTTVCIGEGETGLIYYNHAFKKQLPCGVYRFWNYSTEVTYEIVDLKRTELEISGQEILTKDKVGVRMNLNCAYKVVDALPMVEKIGDHKKQLYSYVQLIIRELVGAYRLDELLEQKNQISESIFAKLKEKEGDFYVEFLAAGIKDIILPGEIRDIMNTVLVAEKEAQAKVIARREEVASTRSLMNTAKLMDENKTLFRLKELEYVERICDRVGDISLSGNIGVVEQLGKMFGVEV